MIIHLNADWRVRSDPLQWILECRADTDKARENDRWRVVGFFHTLDQALLQAVQRGVRLIPVYGPDALDPLLTTLDNLAADIRVALSGLDGLKPERMK